MEGWVLLLILILGAFIFSFAGVIFLLAKTSRLEKSIQILRLRLERLQDTGSRPAAVQEYTVVKPDEPEPELPAEQTAVIDQAALTKPPKQNRHHTAILSFIKGANLWAVAGVILLIIGFGTLIAYLGSRGFFTVEMGIAAAAAAGLVMILSGWRFRLKRPVFFLVLQGGGIGLLYLSIFAAHKLSGLFSLPLSLALMTVLIPPTVILALFQNARFLAALGFLGGFAAPILLSSGEGNHLFLFIYYTIINAGVLAIGFFRTWKSLNRLAFIFTFGVSLYWTMDNYLPEYFLTSEPFFIVFIIIFTVLGLRGLKNSSKANEGVKTLKPDLSDLLLILGTPAAAIVLQWKVFSFIEHGYSIIAIVFSAFYLIITMLILKKFPAWKICAEGYLALGAILANMVIPLELSPDIAGAIWAAEGAVLFFLGLRMFSKERKSNEPGDKRIMAAGIIVHAAAALAFIRDIYFKWQFEDIARWRSPVFIGAIIIALSALFMAVLAEKLTVRHEGKKQNTLAWAIAIWGFIWWFGGWYFEFRRILPEPGGAFLLLASASAFICFLKLRFFSLGVFAAGMIPAPLFAAFTVLGVYWHNSDKYLSRAMELVFTYNFFDPVRLIGWLSFLLFHGLTLIPFRPLKSTGDIKELSNKKDAFAWFNNARIFIFLLTALAVLSASGRFFTVEYGLSASWTSLAGLLPLFAFLIITRRHREYRGTESAEKGKKSENYKYPSAALSVALPVMVSFILGLWFIVSLFHHGDPSPLTFYVPVLNPLDLLEGLCIACIVFWQVKSDPVKMKLMVLADIMVFFWIVSVLARSVHYYAGIPWHRVSSSDAFQLSLFIFWALYGIFHIILGHKKKHRLPWIAGAILVAMDIAKLILFDMSGIGAVPRILSFFAAGLVLLFIGWAAPLPPAAAKQPTKEDNT